MKKKILFILILISLKGYSQYIDDLVKKYNKDGIDSFSKTLDYSYTVEFTKQGVFNVDTINLDNGKCRFFDISLTMISGTVVAEGAFLFSVYNNNGIYTVLSNAPLQGWHGTTSVSITPVSINSNTMCVIRILTGNLTIHGYYTRSLHK
jgi:hypothetical protein